MSLSHEEKVNRVVAQIEELKRSSGPLKIQKNSVSHFVPNPHGRDQASRKVDIKALDALLEIDTERQIAVAEPGLTFSELVRHALQKKFVPYTVPELKTITVGGAVSGCSLESMSYRYGGFHDSCLEYELVSGEGEVLTCSEQHAPELFEMMHGSYGTLGILTKLTFRLLPAKPFVRMTYKTFETFDDFWAYLAERCERGDHDFVDALLHSPRKMVVCLGDMVETAPYTSSYDWLGVFYKSTANRQEDYLTTYDYFFRYDTECHWLSRTVPLLETKPVRFLLGKFVLGSSNMIKWSKRLEAFFRLQKRPDVVVDVFVPSRNFASFFDWYRTEFDFWPLWVVPYRAPKDYPWISDEHRQRMGERFLVDCAIYGKPNRGEKDFSEILERKVFELDGIKTLISRNHYDEERFWQIYSRPRYEAVKSRLDPGHLFADLYEKFHPRRYSKE